MLETHFPTVSQKYLENVRTPKVLFSIIQIYFDSSKVISITCNALIPAFQPVFEIFSPSRSRNGLQSLDRFFFLLLWYRKFSANQQLHFGDNKNGTECPI